MHVIARDEPLDQMDPEARTHPTRPGLARLAIRWFAMLCVPAILAASCSYLVALRGGGNTSMVERSVEWLRGHHYGDAVSRIENIYYSHNQPSSGGTLAGGVPAAASNGTAVTRPVSTPAVADGIPPLATQPLPNEGVWQPLGDSVQGATAMQVAYLRPDDIHGSVLAAVVRIDQNRAAFQIVPGSDEPGHGPWTGGSSVPAADMTNLIAAFNSGFRIGDARGGFMKAGKTVGTLRDGGASLVLSADGHLGIGVWGRDVTPADHPLVVRQNLDLIVDGSQPVPGLDDNSANRWGHTVGNKLYVWRSGIGIDSAGRILYVASAGLSVQSLAALLQHAGAIRAMELDINHAWVSFNTFHHDVTGAVQGTKLLNGMSKSSSRYLTPDTRDFVAVISRQPVSA